MVNSYLQWSNVTGGIPTTCTQNRQNSISWSNYVFFFQDRHQGKDYFQDRQERICALVFLMDTAKSFFPVACANILSLVSFFTDSSRLLIIISLLAQATGNSCFLVSYLINQVLDRTHD